MANKKIVSTKVHNGGTKVRIAAESASKVQHGAMKMSQPVKSTNIQC